MTGPEVVERPKARIFIVEDEPFIAVTLEDMLNEIGFAVAGAVNRVDAALDFLRREPIDAALLDVNLGADNVEPVADYLASRACPFLFTTGYGRSGVPPRHAGSAVLEKPFRIDDLAKALNDLLGRTS